MSFPFGWHGKVEGVQDLESRNLQVRFQNLSFFIYKMDTPTPRPEVALARVRSLLCPLSLDGDKAVQYRGLTSQPQWGKPRPRKQIQLSTAT